MGGEGYKYIYNYISNLVIGIWLKLIFKTANPLKRSFHIHSRRSRITFNRLSDKNVCLALSVMTARIVTNI